MDPTYFLLLIFVPVPVMLLYAIIVDIYDRKKQSKLFFITSNLKRYPLNPLARRTKR